MTTYTAKTAIQLRTLRGSLLEKMADEHALIEAAILAPAPTSVLDLSSIVVGTETTGSAIKIGATASMLAINTASQMGIAAFFSTTATSGTTYGEYIRLNGSGAGEKIAGRHKTLLTGNGVADAYGHHATLEFDTSAGALTGQGAGLRGNLVVANRAIANGSVYGIFAEIYALGNSAALPANSNAVLGLNIQPGTAMDLVANYFAFNGTVGDGKAIHNAAPDTLAGSVRVLINGVAAYIPYYTNQHA